jgi:hypothetical protein
VLSVMVTMLLLSLLSRVLTLQQVVAMTLAMYCKTVLEVDDR